VLGACALLACTAPNPAYHLDDLPGPDHQPPARPDGGPADSSRSTGDGSAGTLGADSPVFGITGVDSLAVDGDGTLYFDQNEGSSAWIGRRLPDGRIQPHWVSVTEGNPTRGLALDGTHRKLYLTAAFAPAYLDVIDLDAAAPTTRIVAMGLSDPNDLALGPDGEVYVSEQSDRNIYRFTSAGARTLVTKSPIGDVPADSGPAGLAFGPDGWLYVGFKGTGKITRLRLTGGIEAQRLPYGTLVDWANGLAFDQKGRLYVALYGKDISRSVVRLDSDVAAPVTLLMGPWFSGIAFGRGALDPRQLFVAEPMGPLHRLQTDTAGAPLR
jgi:sugar lactone lactonase YvrE